MREETSTRIPGQHGSRVAVIRQHPLGYYIQIAVVSSASVTQPSKDRRERYHKEDHQPDCTRSNSFEHLCLSKCARKTIEQNGGSCSMSSESLGDDLGHVAIRNEPAGFETGAYPRAERCAVLDFLAQGVADRDVHHVEMLHKMAALGALAGTGRPREHDERRVRADACRRGGEERPLFAAKHAAHPVRAARSRAEMRSSAYAVRRPWRASTDVTAASCSTAHILIWRHA